MPAAHGGEIGKVDVGGLARRGDGRAVQRVAITREEGGRFVAEKFCEHGAGVFHRGAERAATRRKPSSVIGQTASARPGHQAFTREWCS